MTDSGLCVATGSKAKLPLEGAFVTSIVGYLSLFENNDMQLVQLHPSLCPLMSQRPVVWVALRFPSRVALCHSLASREITSHAH